ncbi:Hypothetical predicted protein [Octopus vulgaris]|uniref:Uncharacterized protein n=1 Tax=Octopus vulgaris TaxID=6645 RepID=A0AA36BTA5_OCTVU|nr:Hypothetical predicted protein [Octopus vulgaris]
MESSKEVQKSSDAGDVSGTKTSESSIKGNLSASIRDEIGENWKEAAFLLVERCKTLSVYKENYNLSTKFSYPESNDITSSSSIRISSVTSRKYPKTITCYKNVFGQRIESPGHRFG